MPEVVFPLDPRRSSPSSRSLATIAGIRISRPRYRSSPATRSAFIAANGSTAPSHNDDSADDVLNAPLPSVHVLSGPIAVQGAKPGDLLIVDILDVGPIPQEDSGPLAGQGWGYTGVFATKNGGGFLTEQFPDAYKVIWDFQGGVATSRHVPGVSYVGIVHPGLMGTAPSAALLAKWNAREQALIDTDPDRVPPLALPPLPDSAILGSLSGAEFERAAAEAARTAPPRENGGNQDIKNFTKGTRVFYPVFVDGANLSMGDLHFSQGDGEITFCGAIEMGGFIDLHVDLIKGGMETYGVSENAIFMPGTRRPAVQPRGWRSRGRR